MPIDRSAAAHQAYAFNIYEGFTRPLELEDDLKTRVTISEKQVSYVEFSKLADEVR